MEPNKPKMIFMYNIIKKVRGFNKFVVGRVLLLKRKEYPKYVDSSSFKIDSLDGTADI